jgi:hypothetical protein
MLVETRRNGQMTHFFHIRGEALFADEEGQYLRSEAVPAEAQAVALEIIGDGLKGGQDRRRWRIEVANDLGHIVLNETLEQAAGLHDR